MVESCRFHHTDFFLVAVPPPTAFAYSSEKTGQQIVSTDSSEDKVID